MTNIDHATRGRGDAGKTSGPEVAGRRGRPGPRSSACRGRPVAGRAGRLPLVACVGLLGAGTARADTIAGAITSITTTSTDTAQWDRVDFACTWAVPDGSSPGDTFGLQLPPELRWFGSTDFDLEDPDGQAVARAHADDDGSVVFTLTDYVLHPPDRPARDLSLLDPVRRRDHRRDRPPRLRGRRRGRAGRRRHVRPVHRGLRCRPHRTQQVHVVARHRADRHPVGDPRSRHDVGPQRRDHHRRTRPRPGPRLRHAHGDHRQGSRRRRDRHRSPRRRTVRAEISCTTQAVSVTWSDVPAGEYTELWVRADVVDPYLATYANAGSVVGRRSHRAGRRPRSGTATPAVTGRARRPRPARPRRRPRPPRPRPRHHHVEHEHVEHHHVGHDHVEHHDSPSTTATGSGTFTGPGSVTSPATTRHGGRDHRRWHLLRVTGHVRRGAGLHGLRRAAASPRSRRCCSGRVRCSSASADAVDATEGSARGGHVGRG